MNNILFICKYNRFRSKVAESIFNKLNKNKKIKAKSAGLIKGSPISQEAIKVLKSLGYIIKGKPTGISTKLLKWQDTIIIVANDVPWQIFHEQKKFKKKLIVFKIPDTKENNKKEIKNIIKKIEKNIKDLLNIS